MSSRVPRLVFALHNPSLDDLNNYKDRTIGIPSDAYEKHLRRRYSLRVARPAVHDFAFVLSRFALDRRAV